MADAAVNISHVVEEHAPDVVSDQGKTQFYIVEEQSIAAQRESSRLVRRSPGIRGCTDIARTRLIVRKRAEGIRTSAEEPLRQRHCFLIGESSRRRERRDYSELSLARQHNVFREGVVSRVSDQHPAKAPL